MNPRAVAQHVARISLSLIICISLLSPGMPTLVSEAAPGQSAERAGLLRRTKPEGDLPDLEEVKRESQDEREAPPPIPSTLRSQKNPSQPWDGRRVGDPGTNGTERGSVGSSTAPMTRRAHARRRVSPPPLLDDQLVQNFFTWALLRNPTSNETSYWYDQLRVGYSKSQLSLRLAALELGKTLFESAEYAARNRTNHWYVYDLYKSYLMREPDSGGWAYWEALVPTIGRESVRRGFEESTEFASLMGSVTPNGSVPGTAASLLTARVEPRNQPGHGMLARDAVWSVPLLTLPGRSGLDLGLALSYSSQVWTRSGPYIYFDEDNGFPSPGFRLGFPTMQRKAFNAQTGKNAYLLLTAAGRRVELRQIDASNIYEAADSSYLQLTENATSWLVRSTDGTQLTFTELNNEYRCTQIKDRNGNYLTINYNTSGRLTNITDTLGRLIVFNYDANANLLSLTQSWNGQPSHQWVSFGWGTRTMQSSFSGAAVVGTASGTLLPVLTQVALNDTSYFTFDYTNSLQVSVIRNYFGAMERNAVSFTYETPAADVPRLVDSRVSARNWTGLNGVPAQLITQYSVAGDGACILTAPDGTIYKEYYGSGWQKALTLQSEVWTGAVRQKWTTTAWTQDDTTVSYERNPRVTETNVYDGSNRRRTVIEYGSYAQFGLPYAVREFAADGTTEIRQTFTDYNLDPAYLNQRIIGLVSYVHVSNVAQWQAKVSYTYDDPARLAAMPTAATQHDTTFGTSFTARGNVTAVSRWDVTDINNAAKKLTGYTNYNTTGNAISMTDPGGHVSSIAYADSFSDSLNRNTFAYPTTLTDAGGFPTLVQYNFDFGATTRTQSPAPAGQSQGAIQTMTYNNLGQLDRVTTTNNGAYKRFWYGPDYTASYATVNNVADELYAIEVVDGVGRVIGAASNHPGSTGGYRLVNTIYNLLGQAVKQSNPTEITSAWTPSGDDAAGLYYTQQTYDWKGRPLVTTNPDGTTREASYAGCGCAGGEVVTLTDEGTIDAGVAKRRQQKIYSDVLGRTVKTEILNWQGGSPYATTVTTYNVRDQVAQVREYAGAEGSSTYQDTTLTYDGYGRLKTKHVPEQNANKATTWDYNPDGTIQKITDARDASTTYTYNSRHLVTGVSYSVPSGSQISVPSSTSYTYDDAANRTSMTDGTGSTNYSLDSLSRMTSESRTFAGVSGTYALNYSYNLGNALTTLSIPFKSQQIGYNHDSVGRLSGVTASGFSATYSIWPNQYTQNLTSFASNITYRAWGGRKSMIYGNTTGEQLTYNARMQPTTYTLTNMNYQNKNICCSYPTYSTMTWTFGYYDDGSLKQTWDSTNEWFDRAYKYDHVGRLKEASTFRRARGLSPYPAINYPDPYYQSITYDAFNHSSRTGKLYTGELSDSGSYVNNRRTDFGWQYDAAGNATRDPSYDQTFDAAGTPIHSVAHQQVGDGEQYPLEPRLDITQTYDGTGAPAKRVQISRMPGISDQFGNQSEPLVDTQTTYYVKSSVLGGAPVAEIGLGDTLYIYAGGQRLAREFSGSVTFEHHNPVTGSWLTSNGHSSYRTTYREERDPHGAEIPQSDPYAYAQSYVDWKFSQPLFIEGGDPFDYSSGRVIDGLPVSEAEFQRRIGHGSAGAGIFVGGNGAGFVDLSRTTFLTHITLNVFRPDLELLNHPELWGAYWVGSFEAEIQTSKRGPRNKAPAQRQNPQRVPLQTADELQGEFMALLRNKKCADFVSALIRETESKMREHQRLDVGTDRLNFEDLFENIHEYLLVDNLKANGMPVNGTIGGAIWNGDAQVHIRTRFYITEGSRRMVASMISSNRRAYLATAFHETFHHLARSRYGSLDSDLGRAAFKITGDTYWLPGENGTELQWSSYFDEQLMEHCMPDQAVRRLIK